MQGQISAEAGSSECLHQQRQLVACMHNFPCSKAHDMHPPILGMIEANLTPSSHWMALLFVPDEIVLSALMDETLAFDAKWVCVSHMADVLSHGYTVVALRTWTSNQDMCCCMTHDIVTPSF